MDASRSRQFESVENPTKLEALWNQETLDRVMEPRLRSYYRANPTAKQTATKSPPQTLADPAADDLLKLNTVPDLPEGFPATPVHADQPADKRAALLAEFRAAAGRHIEQLERLTKQPSENQVKAYNNLGCAYLLTGNVGRGQSCLFQALTIARTQTNPDPPQEVIEHNLTIGYTYSTKRRR